MNQRFKAHAAVAGANIIYGVNFIVMKEILNNTVTPFTLNLLRIIGATLLFWLLYFTNKYILKKQETKPSIKLQKADYVHLLICVVTGVIINQIMFVKGVALTTPFRASLLMLFTPIAVVFFSLYFQKQNITKNKLVGLGLGLIGAAILISLREKTAAKENHLLGDIFIIINALSYAFYLVWVKQLTTKYQAMDVMRWMFTVSLFMVMPFGFSNFTDTNWSSISNTQYVALGFIVVFVTFLVYVLNTYSIRVLGSTVTGAYIYTQPFFASALFIYLTGNTEFLGLKIVAAFLIFIGLYLVSFFKNKT